MGKSKEMSAFLLPYDKEMLLDRLTDEQAGKLFRHLYAYAKREDTPNDERDNSILIVFDCFRTYIEKNKESYQEISTKRQEAAKKRWNKEEDAKGCKCMQMDANDANAHFAMQRDANDAISISKSKSILSERETPPTPSKGKGGVSPSLLTKAKSLFRKSYEEIEGKPYAWTKKDERAMESLIGKLQYCYPSSTDKEILSFLDRFVENSVCNQWVSENLSVSILDLKFNELNKLLNA